MAGVSALVAAARAGIENLRPVEVAAELTQRDALLVDVREAREATKGVIPGAVVVPRGTLEFRADPGSAHFMPVFTGAQRVIVYCTDGSRSALAGRPLQDLGYADVAHLEGGISAWADQGGPLVPYVG
jgi:rhodanese-related sulfurtransferase